MHLGIPFFTKTLTKNFHIILHVVIFPNVLIMQMILFTTWDQQRDLNHPDHLEVLEHILKGSTSVFVMCLL